MNLTSNVNFLNGRLINFRGVRVVVFQQQQKGRKNFCMEKGVTHLKIEVVKLARFITL